MKKDRRGNMNNLVDLRDRTPEERERIARMGADATNNIRREKKRTLELLELMLAGEITYNDANMTREQAYVLATINKGIESGKTELLELLARLRGELVQKQEVDVKTLPAVLTEEIVDDDEEPSAPKKKSAKRKTKEVTE